MATVEKARVFMSGRSQAVRIPVEFRFASDEVFIRRDPQSGEIILSERPNKPSMAEIFAMLDEAGGMEDLFEDRDMTPPQERDWMRAQPCVPKACIYSIPTLLATSRMGALRLRDQRWLRPFSILL